MNPAHPGKPVPYSPPFNHKALRLLLIDSDPETREAVQQALPSKVWSFETCSGICEALDRLQGCRPDVILLGSCQPDIVKEISLRFADAVTLVLLLRSQAEMTPRLLGAGAHGFIEKPPGVSDVRQAIARAIRGELVLPPWTQSALADFAKKITRRADSTYRLSAREYEVVEHLARGRTEKEIAATLGVAVSTVHEHLKRAYKKLGVATREEAVRTVFRSFAAASSLSPKNPLSLPSPSQMG